MDKLSNKIGFVVPPTVNYLKLPAKVTYLVDWIVIFMFDQ